MSDFGRFSKSMAFQWMESTKVGNKCQKFPHQIRTLGLDIYYVKYELKRTRSSGDRWGR